MRLGLITTHPVQYHAPWFRALVAEGVDLHVFYSFLPDRTQQSVGFGTAFAWDVPLLEGYSWSVLPQVRRNPDLGRFLGSYSAFMGGAVARFDPDVVLLTGWNALPLVQGLLSAVRLGIPTVVRGESNALKPRPAWKTAGHRALLSLYDSFIAIGMANRDFYERNGVSPEQIVDGGYFVDETHFLELRGRDCERRAQLRRSWGVPEGACCFLFAAKLQAKKRPLDFLAGLDAAARSLPAGSVHGLVVGSGELEDAMRTAASTCAATVSFAGFLNQTEIGAAYAAADALVLPSDWGETWGLVVNEAMLFGLPAIVSDRVGCGPDLVVNGETGFVVPFGDGGNLGARMADLAGDTSRRTEMGRRGFDRVLRYSPRRGARATIEAARIAMGES